MRRSSLKRTSLRPKGPLRRSRPINKGRKALQRGRRLPKVNKRRRAALRLKQFGPPAYVPWLIAHACCTCGHPAQDPSHAAKSRGAGGRARHQVPQCRGCHNLLHARGPSAFPGVDFRAAAERFWREAIRKGIISREYLEAYL